jgi:hypothetical protein
LGLNPSDNKSLDDSNNSDTNHVLGYASPMSGVGIVAFERALVLQ